MNGRVETSWGRAELLYVIRRIRRRWRIKLALRGLAAVGAVSVIALAVAAVVASASVERWDFAPQLALGLRIGLAVAVLAAVIWFLIIPLRRRVSDERVALYLEEHEPSLDAAVLSAMDAIDGNAGLAASKASGSVALLRRTVEAALERCRAIDNGIRVERRGLRLNFAAVAAMGLGAWALAVFGPANLRQGARLLLFPAPGAAAVTPVSVQVLPGDTTIARGADQIITARLEGFTTEGAELVLRTASDSVAERLYMAAADEPGTYGVLLFDLEEDTEYFVEADGVRSALYHLTIAELPYAGRIDLEYRYPAYTDMPPRTVEDGGDIAALEGTVVHLRVHSTLPVPAGRIVLDDGRSTPLTSAADSVLTGTLRVEREGFYHIEFQGADGRAVVGSSQYIVDPLSDAPPTVTFSEPGRDLIATPIEEVYIEAEAADDFGVAGLELVYSVNGGPEQTVELYGAEDALPEVSAGHTFYLEEFELEPGDFVAYHARATDNDAVHGAKRVSSDLYFLEIRPFEREYRQAEQAGAPGGGGRGGSEQGLSERQRRIIAATFNLSRDSATYAAPELAENLVTIRLAQERLEDEVRGLARQMVMRGVTADSGFRAIADMLPQAADEMEAATARLRDQQPTGALPPEQRALVHLQRAEAVFREVMVGFGAPGGGGGGGAANAEELADLFELERDQLEDPYETLQRGAPDSVSQEIDETAARLEELARRQQRESEWQRRRALAQQGGQAAPAGGGSPGSQRELAEQVEEEARRLERLSRENARPELMETANRLRQAADAMRRAAANGASGSADAEAARERLEEARRSLNSSRGAATEQRARQALDRLDQIAGEQSQLSDSMRALAGTPRSEARSEQARRLAERIDAQTDRVADLQRELHRLAAEARDQQAEAARRLDEAAASIRENQLEQKIALMQRLTPPGVPPEYLEELETEIGADLEELRGRLDRAVQAFEPPTGDPAAEALNRAGDLARGISSLGERLGASADRGGRAVRSRQFRREAAERLEDAGQLRERLRRAGRDVGQLDQVMDGLRRLADTRVYGDPEELARLRAALTELVQRFEYGLRQELAAEEQGRLFLSGSGEVPAEFRELVEEYYRALAGGREGQNEERR